MINITNILLKKSADLLWKETFSIPLLKFDDVWIIDGNSICIRDAEKVNKKYVGLGRGEK